MAPDDIAPDDIAPDDIAPDDIAPDDIAPDDIGAEDIGAAPPADIGAEDIGAEDIGADDIGAAPADDIGAAAELMAEELVDEEAAEVVLLDPQATRARARPPAVARAARRLMIMEVLLLTKCIRRTRCPRRAIWHDVVRQQVW